MHNAIGHASAIADAQWLSGAQRLLDERDFTRSICGIGGAEANRMGVNTGLGAHNRYAPAQVKGSHALR